jgi:muramoyltetrapeptide carboxypeptidase
MIVLGALLGTALEPDLSGHVLLLEEVSEHMYAIDRALYHLAASAAIQRVAGIRLGRLVDVRPNEPDFGEEGEEMAAMWCQRYGISWLGCADIGHDSANKVVPFGHLAPA